MRLLQNLHLRTTAKKLKELSEACTQRLTEIKNDRKLVRRAAKHMSIGAAALVVTVFGAVPVIYGSADRAEPAKNDEAAVQPAETRQTVYAVESWWKAGINEYDLIEYTHSETESVSEEAAPQAISYPNISFTVSGPDGAAASMPTVYPHAEYGTRDISNEYYTVKSVTSGAIVSGNGHELVCRVLSGELGGGFSDEAMKAQAVAIYSYIRYCDANGMLPVVAVASGYSSRVERIVSSVEGQVCTYGGAPINALFCSSTAGNSIGSESVWSRALPYLKPVFSKYDSIDPNYGVKTYFSADEIKRMVESNTDIVLDPNDVEHWFEIKSRLTGKYVNVIAIGGRDRCSVRGSTRTLTAAVLRESIMGNQRLRSTAFDISYNNGVFCFTTYGFGHGVGMSQNGAQLLSTIDGLKYDQILRYYYTGITISCSGVNQPAVDRYGQSADISDLEEASPSGSVPSDDDADKDNTENADKQDADSQKQEQPADTSAADEETPPEVSDSGTADTTSAPQTSPEKQSDTASVSESEKPVTTSPANNEPVLE